MSENFDWRGMVMFLGFMWFGNLAIRAFFDSLDQKSRFGRWALRTLGFLFAVASVGSLVGFIGTAAQWW